MMRRYLSLVLVAAVLVLAVPAGGCVTKTKTNADTTTPVRKNYTIEIKNFAFSPEKVTVAVESRVTWTNKDPAPHSITAKLLDSGLMGQGDSYSYQFLKTGTYTYHCSIHPYMEGVIVVK